MSKIHEIVAQARWSQEALGSNAWFASQLVRQPLRALQRSLGDDPVGWAELIQPPQERTIAENLAAEVGPLADACRWLRKQSSEVLKPRREGGWFDSLTLRVERKPLGVVLVIGASNYPLFLLAAPAIQALAAGNAVLLKPPPGGEAVAEKLREVLVEGGLDENMCHVLDSSVEAAEAAIDARVDHVVATGSSETGRAVARRAAEQLTSCTLECSGNDAVILLPSADLDRVASCVAWGLRFNSGATCIAPRFAFANTEQLDSLEQKLAKQLADAEPRGVYPQAIDDTRRLVGEAIDSGARVVSPVGFSRYRLEAACDTGRLPPIVLRFRSQRPPLFEEAIFSPVFSLIDASEHDEETIKIVSKESGVSAEEFKKREDLSSLCEANDSRYALGASIFGDRSRSENWAGFSQAGCVTINDLIAPTADPRVPFGGAGESGYGVTRGAEGLLAMTRPQAIVRRRGRWLPHLDPPTPALEELLSGMIRLKHGSGLASRWRGVRQFFSAAREHQQHQKRER